MRNPVNVALAASIVLGGCSTVALEEVAKLATSKRGIVLVSAASDSTGQTGQLAISMELPNGGRKVSTLPDTTDKVEIDVAADALSSPVQQVISRSQFVNGQATMVVQKLPLGPVSVTATIFDASGAQVTMGNATAVVTANTVTPITLNLVVKAQTGGISVGVDARTQYADTPVVTVPALPPIAPVSVTLAPPSRSYNSPSWKSTSVSMMAGQTIRITSSGTVGYNYNTPYNYNYFDATGCGCGTGGLSSSFPSLALVGRLQGTSQTDTFLVGRDFTYTAPFNGNLVLGVNTWVDSTNSWYYFGGSFTAAVKGV